MEINRYITNDIYGYVEFKDGSKLYIGHSRPAFSMLLVKPDSSKFWVEPNDQIMITGEARDQIKARSPKGWDYEGIKDGKIQVAAHNNSATERFEVATLDATDLLTLIDNHEGPFEDIETEEQADEIWQPIENEMESLGVPL